MPSEASSPDELVDALEKEIAEFRRLREKTLTPGPSKIPAKSPVEAPAGGFPHQNL